MNEYNELSDFERDLLLSIEQAQRGEFAAVHTPQALAQRRAGRPAATDPRTPISIRLPRSVLQKWRSTGPGWQTRMAEVLSRAV